MPRYKNQTQKVRPLRTWHPLLKWGIIVVGAIIFILLVTLLIKRIARHTPPVYGSTVGYSFLSKPTLISKINALQSQLASDQAQLSTLAQLQNENDTLKTELGRIPPPSGILANVISLPNRSFYDTMNIDAGSAEGIKTNMTAYAFDAVALGTITSVSSHTATVQLFSTPGHQMTGTAVGSNVAVTLIGRGGGEYEVQLPRGVPFDVGSTVAMQSTDVATLATVEKVITDARDPFQRLLAKAPVNLQSLKWVIVR
jgi:cell shape-determining protein MreC